MDEWYHEANGAAQGPMPKAQLAALLRDGVLTRTTYVWTPAFGDTWRQVHETDLPDFLPVRRPPRRISPSGGPARNKSAGPPPVAWVWGIALSPLALLAIDIGTIAATGHPNEPANSFVNAISVSTLMTLAVLDGRGVTKAGRNPKGRYLVPFMLLAPPGYLWRRARVAGTSLRHLWIWFAALAGFLIGEFILVVLWG